MPQMAKAGRELTLIFLDYGDQLVIAALNTTLQGLIAVCSSLRSFCS